MKVHTLIVLSLFLCTPALADHSREHPPQSTNYVPSLITATPYEGRQLAITLVRKTIGSIQRDGSIKQAVRAEYADDAQLLIHAAELVVLEFKTIAIANNYWRKEK